MIKVSLDDQLKNFIINHGTQEKMVIDNQWYKIDVFYYEGLAESIASDILKKSNIKEFVRYEPEIIFIGNQRYNGCRS